MLKETSNRMEIDGPDRIKDILGRDRRIVGSIFMRAVIATLQNDYRWNREEVELFHQKVQNRLNSD